MPSGLGDDMDGGGQRGDLSTDRAFPSCPSWTGPTRMRSHGMACMEDGIPVRWAAGRPFVWLDDEIEDVGRRWVSDHHSGRALLYRVDPYVGLTRTSRRFTSGSPSSRTPGRRAHMPLRTRDTHEPISTMHHDQPLLLARAIRDASARPLPQNRLCGDQHNPFSGSSG
jgi:hypothetical protein